MKNLITKMAALKISFIWGEANLTGESTSQLID